MEESFATIQLVSRRRRAEERVSDFMTNDRRIEADCQSVFLSITRRKER